MHQLINSWALGTVTELMEMANHVSGCHSIKSHQIGEIPKTNNSLAGLRRLPQTWRVPVHVTHVFVINANVRCPLCCDFIFLYIYIYA